MMQPLLDQHQNNDQLQVNNKLKNNKKNRAYLPDIVPTQTVVFIFSFLHLMDLIKSATKINKHFHHYVMQCSSHLWRQYCKKHSIKNPDTEQISWESLAINDIKQQLNIYKLRNWDFPTLHQDRVNIESKYIRNILNDGLINYKQLKPIKGCDNNILFEYESIEHCDFAANLKPKSLVHADNKDIIHIDSFIIQSFDRLRALGNYKLDKNIVRATDNLWKGYKQRGDVYWREISGDNNTIEEWLCGALFPRDEFMFNLYSVNNRRGMGQFGKTDEEQSEDDKYIDSAQSFIDLVTDTFCNDNDNFRFYIAGHIRSDQLDLDRDEMIIAINDIKVFGFYVYYSRYYG